MLHRHCISDNTYNRILIDSGEVRMGYIDEDNPGTLLGATKGGSSFTIQTTYLDLPIDGVEGSAMGGRFIINVIAQITANFVEYSTDLLKLALPGSSESIAGDTHDEITRSFMMASNNYKSNIVIIGEICGNDKPVICGIKNALADNNLKISFSDNDESILSVQFTGHFSESDLDLEPWFIWYPHEMIYMVESSDRFVEMPPIIMEE